MAVPSRAENAHIAFTVFGQCYSMKNSHILARGRTIKHPKARQFEQDFGLQVPPEAKRGLGSQDRPLMAIVSVWYPSWRQDVDVEIVWDLLQKCGVVSNDRWIREKHIFGARIDPINPRVEIEVSEI